MSNKCQFAFFCWPFLLLVLVFRISECSSSGNWHIAKDGEKGPCNIPRLPRLSRAEFMSVYFLRKPFILSGGSHNNLSRWSKPQILLKFGSRFVETGSVFSLSKAGQPTQKMTLQKYVEILDGNIANNSSSNSPYLFDRGNFFLAVPELREEFTIHPLFGTHNHHLTFTLGQSGSGLTFHHHLDAWLEVVFHQIMILIT